MADPPPPLQPPVPAGETPQPVAYDQQGRPLYAHPPAAPVSPADNQQPPPVVYMTRPAEPLVQHISDAAKQKHELSKQRYPSLNLSEGEYVISAVKRHPIGLFSIWAVVAIIMGMVYIGGPILIAAQSPDLLALIKPDAVANAALFLILLAAFFIVGGIVATVIYLGNRFYLTNESVIQRIQHDLLSHKEQTISLANIEDASYRQSGLIQMLFHYGSLRLSTEGDETTYRFSFVANPKHQVDLLNNAVEAFKNGRPVDTSDENY